MKLDLPTIGTTAADNLGLSADMIAYALGKAAFLAAILLSWSAGITWSHFDKFEYPAIDLSTSNGDLESAPKALLSDYKVITNRNIFGAVAPKIGLKPKITDSSPLKLRLVGTYVKQGSNPFAIIEDSSKKEQDVFDLKDSVFSSNATLDKINTESVELLKGGKTIILTLEDSQSPSSNNEDGIKIGDEGSEFTIPEEELNTALANLPRLLSQARAVPYFRNGKSIGMRLFAIRKGSMYEKLGLKNGDIILSVNDNSLSDPSQALKIFNQLKSERSIYLMLERFGNERELRYSIE